VALLRRKAPLELTKARLGEKLPNLQPVREKEISEKFGALLASWCFERNWLRGMRSELRSSSPLPLINPKKKLTPSIR
jgi:hypothetical protein